MDSAAMDSQNEACFGPNRAAARPSSHEYAWFYGDPEFGGVEASGGGYARVTVDGDTDWLPSDGGEMATVWFDMPTSTGAYDSEVTHWALIYDDGGDVIDRSGPISGGSVVIDEAGTTVMARVVIRFANSIVPEED